MSSVSWNHLIINVYPPHGNFPPLLSLISFSPDSHLILHTALNLPACSWIHFFPFSMIIRNMLSLTISTLSAAPAPTPHIPSNFKHWIHLKAMGPKTLCKTSPQPGFPDFNSYHFIPSLYWFHLLIRILAIPQTCLALSCLGTFTLAYWMPSQLFT